MGNVVLPWNVNSSPWLPDRGSIGGSGGFVVHGGGGGSGGAGGVQGGASLGFLMIRSHVELSGVVFTPGRGGSGGAGGNGGRGGGSGFAGGPGAGGAGGAVGPMISVLYDSTSTVTQLSRSKVHPDAGGGSNGASPGKGGRRGTAESFACPGTASSPEGPVGVVYAFYQLPPAVHLKELPQ